DMLYASSSTAFSKLGIGSNGQCLIVSSGLPVWGACGAGTVTGTGTNPQVAYWTSSTNIGSATGVDIIGTANLRLGNSTVSTGLLTVASSGSSNTFTLSAAPSMDATLTYRWPGVSPTAGQFLSASAPSGGIVTLSWATGTVTGSGASCQVAYW